MNTIELLQKSIDYIEENLKCELTIHEIAEISGFSIYHFCHIFCNSVGMPVSAFITKRRLHHAIFEIQNYGKLVDTALLYGFDTHAGFYKAFKREFGCSPSKYLKLNIVTRPVAVDLTREVKFMLSQAQLKKILSNWDIDTKYKIEDICSPGSSEQSNYLWTIGENYIFKTGKNIVELRTNISVSKSLSEIGILASCPVKTKSYEDFIVENGRFFVLMSRIPGKCMSQEEHYLDGRFERGYKYGRAIGDLHKILKRQDKSLDLYDNNLLDFVITWALPETKRIMEQWNCPLPESFYSDYIANFSKLYPLLPKQIIHRDPNPGNILFDNGEFSGFVDFDISERNIRIFDPCYCSTGILSEANTIEEGFEKWPEILKGIITGYDRICPLSDVERQAIPYVIYSIQLIFIAYLNGNDAYKNLALQNRKMLVWIMENKAKCFGNL